jgi:cytochrome c biogenesis factor
MPRVPGRTRRLLLSLAVGIGLVAWRGDALRAAGRIDSSVSREAAFLLNNLLFAALAFVVLRVAAVRPSTR